MRMTSLVEHISEDLCLDENYVASIIRRSSRYYREYTIPKKDGSCRKIAQASPELKTLQYWIVRNILEKFPVSQSAFAYKRGDSIKRHAEFHKAAKYIFHTDVKKFFPNITSELLSIYLIRQEQLLTDLGVWYKDTCEVISRICFRYNHLCIGTVSSPVISNIIMYDFDEKLHSYCDIHNYMYSRYADDIYISSSNYIPESIKGVVGSFLSEIGLVINEDKTWFKSKKSQRRITGLIITDAGNVSIGREKRAYIKKMIYNRIINGNGDAETVLGYLAFLKDVEPGTYNKLLIKYTPYCDGDVIEAIKTGPKHKSYPSVSIELPDFD